MNKIPVRSACSDDVDQLSALFVELDEHHTRRRPEEFLALTSPARSIEYIEILLAAPRSTLLIAEDDGAEIVGLGHVVLRDFPATIVTPSRTVAEIDSLVVHADRRRQGIGSALIAAVCEWAADQAVAAVELSVRGYNPEAVAFYRQLGFEVAVHTMRLSTG